MKVILQQDVKKVGKKGEVIEVSEGYGRNFLLPKKMAILATSENLNVAKAQANSAARKKAMENDEAKLMAAQLAKVEINLTVKIGANGKLFGSVGGKDIAEILKKDFGGDKTEKNLRKEKLKGKEESEIEKQKLNLFTGNEGSKNKKEKEEIKKDYLYIKMNIMVQYFLISLQETDIY